MHPCQSHRIDQQHMLQRRVLVSLAEQLGSMNSPELSDFLYFFPSSLLDCLCRYFVAMAKALFKKVKYIFFNYLRNRVNC